MSGHALFSTFVMGLASATLIELGLIEDPLTKTKRVNKEAARQHIDILAMLQDKTRGNLSSDEKDLLERALTDLRLQFAKAT
jgi:hypothetical protein